jgi:hypothetical protein
MNRSILVSVSLLVTLALTHSHSSDDDPTLIHDHDHHDCEHSRLQAEETNIHKLFAIKIGEMTGFCCFIETVD